MWYAIAGAAVILIIIAIFAVNAGKQNKEIRERGIETDAVITRVVQNETVDSDRVTTTINTYYVAYISEDGQTVNAQLGCGKAIDFRIGRTWDDGLASGNAVRIKYLPEKPEYVIFVRKLDEDDR